MGFIGRPKPLERRMIMQCIYCGNKMLFNGVNDSYACVNSGCGAKLNIIQHTDVRTIEVVNENDIKDIGGKQYMGKNDGYNTDGIATRWVRGNK